MPDDEQQWRCRAPSAGVPSRRGPEAVRASFRSCGHANQRDPPRIQSPVRRRPTASRQVSDAGSRAGVYDRGVSDLHAPLLRWYDEHARDLPWRRTTATPWGVLVSEFMLQQTPVARVLPVYDAWLERWPTPGRPGRRAVGRGDPRVGPARLPAPGDPAARRRHRDHRAARRRGAGHLRRPARPARRRRLHGLGRAGLRVRPPAGRCSTPTSAGCWPGSSAASSSRRRP